MTYFYTIMYDNKNDDFYGEVSATISSGNHELFSINDTSEMVDLIKTGVMKHIDDVDGLQSFLKAQEYLMEDDCIILVDASIY